jgi:hypothetical protein
MVDNGAFIHKIDYVTMFFGDSKSGLASKSRNGFNSYSNFAEWVDFAYWWSFSGGGSAIIGTTPSSLKLMQLSGKFLAKEI